MHSGRCGCRPRCALTGAAGRCSPCSRGVGPFCGLAASDVAACACSLAGWVWRVCTQRARHFAVGAARTLRV
eukprot:15450833-Alexandrium_andersonii.AAC.1